VRASLGFAGGALALLIGVAAISNRAAADPRGGVTPADYPQIGLPDPAAARALLAQFREAGFAAGDYFLEFELRQMPRRGDGRTFQGRLWGGRNRQGPVTRIALREGTGQERRLLVQNGPQAAVWSDVNGRVEAMEGQSVLDPIIAGVEVTAFDLQMPYLFWPDVRVAGLNRIRGRPAYAFLFRPPADFAAHHPQLGAVRAYLDTEYDRPLQIELIGRDGGVLKTLSPTDIKKVSGQWMVKEFDVRNEITRDKTRFSLTAVALGLDFAATLLSPDHLAEDAAVPAADRIISVTR
jgi:hypothetical protein